jgi:hypothetical protein
MPDLEYLMPPSARLGTVFRFFVFSLIFFHAWMVFGWLQRLGLKPLKKLGFKVVDYFWVMAGGLALIGTMGQVRQIGSINIANAFDQLAPPVYDPIRVDVDSYLGGQGLSCRTFVRGEWSPPPEVFDRIQNEYNAACEWFQTVSALVPTRVPIEEMDLRLVPPPPIVKDEELNRQIRAYIANLQQHNKAAQYRARLQEGMERSPAEAAWLILAPFLGSFAIALRLAKVTGEILLDRASAPTGAPAVGDRNGLPNESDTNTVGPRTESGA